jgi:hypothetical protein
VKWTSLIPILAVVFTAAVIGIALWGGSSPIPSQDDGNLRRTVGLPSIAIGTNYEGTRNPLTELYVRSLYDIPGGYDYVVSSSFIGTPLVLDFYRELIPGFNLTAQGIQG